MSDPLDLLRLEPEDLDGHTLDELSDYLDRGKQPAVPSIDDSPACRIALAALERLRAVTGSLLDDAEGGDAVGQDWIGRVLAVLPIEARAGRSFPLPVDDPDTEASVTEGALRGLVRSIGDAVPGLLVGSVRIGHPDPETQEVDLVVQVALRYGLPLQDAEAAFRSALRQGLAPHAPFRLGRVDIRVVALIGGPPGPEGTS
jgi:hypothetical protein